MSFNQEKFETEVGDLINRYSLENGSDTPDFILARYLRDCLVAFDAATKRRATWYRPDKPIPPQARRQAQVKP